MTDPDRRDQLIDMLLREIVGRETPPDVKERVLEAIADRGPRLITPSGSVPARPRLQPASSAGRSVLAIAAVLMLVIGAGGWLHFHGMAESRKAAYASGSVSGFLRAGDSFRAPADAETKLTYPDGTVMTLSAGSRVEFPKQAFWDPTKHLLIHRGSLVADVAPQAADSPLWLQSDHGKAVVLGTRFEFHVDDAKARLVVTKGKVRFKPHTEHPPIDVKQGEFAEAGKEIEVHFGLTDPPQVATPQPSPPAFFPPSEAPSEEPEDGVVGFTLMDPYTDEPLLEEPLRHGQRISLSELEVSAISLRADWEGRRPFSVAFRLTRSDGKASGLKRIRPQHHSPFFLTGDHSADDRPEDCRPWTPAPGVYRVTATPYYQLHHRSAETGPSHTVEIHFTE